jgi:UDP-N-acetylmuramate--alanine ligase
LPPLRDRHPEDEILDSGRRRLLAALEAEPRRWLLVDVASQRLLVVEDGGVRRRFGVSTAAAGVDGREGSFGTPAGVHRIGRRIGQDMELGTWFRSREPVGRWEPGGPQDREDLILTRILTLVGCEEGVNRGAGCDSESRFIYIHGTNHEDRIGEPVSHGCIRLSNTDVIHLFDHVAEGDPVVVV